MAEDDLRVRADEEAVHQWLIIAARPEKITETSIADARNVLAAVQRLTRTAMESGEETELHDLMQTEDTLRQYIESGVALLHPSLMPNPTGVPHAEHTPRAPLKMPTVPGAYVKSPVVGLEPGFEPLAPTTPYVAINDALARMQLLVRHDASERTSSRLTPAQLGALRALKDEIAYEVEAELADMESQRRSRVRHAADAS